MDDDTLQFYRRNAEAYAGWAKAPSTRLTGFLALLPPGGAIWTLMTSVQVVDAVSVHEL